MHEHRSDTVRSGAIGRLEENPHDDPSPGSTSCNGETAAAHRHRMTRDDVGADDHVAAGSAAENHRESSLRTRRRISAAARGRSSISVLSGTATGDRSTTARLRTSGSGGGCRRKRRSP
jgi:hypothetical protein